MQLQSPNIDNLCVAGYYSQGTLQFGQVCYYFPLQYFQGISHYFRVIDTDFSRFRSEGYCLTSQFCFYQREQLRVLIFYSLKLEYLRFFGGYYADRLHQKPSRQSYNHIAGLFIFLFPGYSIRLMYQSLSLHFLDSCSHYYSMTQQTLYFLFALLDCFHQLSFLFQKNYNILQQFPQHMNILTSLFDLTRPFASKGQEFSMTESQMPLNNNPGPSLTDQKNRLPKNFAEQIMQLQINLQESNCDINMIKRLNELYMIGLQFYGKNLKSEPRKREHFVKKIQSLYNNKYVAKIVQEDNKRSSNASPSLDCNNDIETAKKHTPVQENQNNQKENNNELVVKRNEVKPILYEAKLKQQISKFTSQSKDVVKGILQQNQKKQVIKEQNIEKMLKNQDENLQNRLEKRAEKKLRSSIVIQNAQNNSS